jgi:acylphosphatase
MRGRLHAVVRGQVQGVGFRMATLRKARSLGLTGWVWNLPGGGVEVEAEGGPQALEQFAAWLRHGPAGAVVQEVEGVPPTDAPPYPSFDIRYCDN